MNLLKIYQTELYKMSKRKINLMLVLPSLLALLVTIGYGSGNLILGVVGEESQLLYSCLDFLLLVWTFIAGTGLYAILMILVAAYQFSGEVEQGQIKMMLLRIGKRSDLLIGKALALLTLFILSSILFITTVIAAYYLYLVPSGTVANTFNMSMMGLSNGHIFGTISAALLGMIIFMMIAYLIGIKSSPFMTFIITLVLMFVTKAIATMESFSFMKYTSFYLENEYMMGSTLNMSIIVPALIVTALLIIGLFSLSIVRFNKVDIK